jgi:alanine-glyoxylate transaminase/serine-glyoxylate transaminase/serine-pyruvate transaminase
MIPGPSELDDAELHLLGEQVRPHYGADWCRLHGEVVDALGRVLGVAEPPYLIPGSGSAGLDAALLNLFEPGQRVVVTRTGYFGDRLAQIARRQGLHVTCVGVAVGQPADPDAVRAAARGAAGVLSVHVETSTGVRHAIEPLAAAAHAAGALLVVDAIASVGGEEVAVDAMGIDALVTAPQKGLEAPAGLAIIALGARGRARLESRRERPSSWYLDLRNWEHHRREGWDWEPPPVTMPTNLVAALGGSLRRLLAQGVSTRVAERADLARRLRAGLRSLGLEPLAAPGCEASLVTVVRTRDADRLAARLLQEHRLMVGRGLAPVPDAIRVGLLGPRATSDAVDRLLLAIASVGATRAASPPRADLHA